MGTVSPRIATIAPPLITKWAPAYALRDTESPASQLSNAFQPDRKQTDNDTAQTEVGSCSFTHVWLEENH